ncbi:hypothetical protein D3C85_985650 [compost metagenome]
MARQCVDADHGDETLVDFQKVDIELAQIAQAGMTGSEIVDGDLHAKLVQLLEQLVGNGRGFDQLAFGQLQHQVDGAGSESGEEFAAIFDQFQVLAVAGSDVDADMKRLFERRRQWPEQGGSLLHQ